MTVSLRLIAIFFGVLSTLAYGCNAGTQNNKKETIMDVQSLGKKLGLVLPPGTEILGVETEAGIDDAIRAKLRIPGSQAQGFIQSCGIARFRHGGADLLGPDHGFWDPHNAKMLRSGEATLPYTRALLIALDESSSDTLVVYAMNYST